MILKQLSKQKNNLISGKNVMVNVQNFSEPPTERRTREIDQDHVKRLEEQFIKNPTVFTVLIGHIPNGTELSDNLEKRSNTRIEVLGGNHTRQALLNIGSVDICVSTNIYQGLSDLQALRLGLQHNEIHQFSKKPTFEDTVKLFRCILKNVESEFRGKGKKGISSEWRDRIACLTDTNVSTNYK